MTKKTNKFSVKKTIIIGIGIMVFLGAATLVSAQTSLLDRIAQVAGQILGKSIYDKVESNLDETFDQPLGGATLSTAWQDQNGLVTYVLGGELPTATTNVLSIRNPFGSSVSSTAATAYERGELTWQQAIGDIGVSATSSVELVVINITTAATSSFLMRCGVAATAYDPPIDTSDVINFEVATGTTRWMTSGNATSTVGTAPIGPAPSKTLLSEAYSFFVCRLYPPVAVGGSVWENGIGFNRDGLADVAAGTISTDNPIRWKAKVQIVGLP